MRNYRGRSVLKLAKMALISPATQKSVEAIYTRRAEFPLPAGESSITKTLPNRKATLKSSSASIASSDPRHVEPAPTEIMPFEKEERNDINRLYTMLDDLQDEVTSMRKVLDISTRPEPSSGDPNLRATAEFEEELDLLADTVSQINDRVDEIDTLKLEVSVLKRRLQRLEEDSISTQSTHTITGLTQDAAQPLKVAKPNGSGARQPSPVGHTAALVPELSNAPELPKTETAQESSTRTADTVPSPCIANSMERVRESSVGREDEYASQAVPSKARSGISLKTLNTSADKQEPQQKTATKANQSRTVISLRLTSSKMLALPSINTSSSSSRISSLSVDSPTFPKTPPTANLRCQPQSATSLNSHKIIPGSDPEDEDYDPRSLPKPRAAQSRGIPRTRGSSRRRRSAPGIPLSLPEWEQHGWPGAASKDPASAGPMSARGRGLLRRGIGGRAPGRAPEPRPHRSPAGLEQEAPRSGEESSDAEGLSRHRRVDEHGNRLRANGLPDKRFLKRSRDDEGILLTSKGTPDGRSVKRPRDEHGFLIRANGQRDGRSAIRGRRRGGGEGRARER